MAAFRYQGIHTPSALPYLVAEGILPEDPPKDSYIWETYHDQSSQNSAFEELLRTDHCVIWSRGGIVQKVFNFDVEQQRIQHAVLTHFPETEVKGSQHRSFGADLGEFDHISRKRRKVTPQHNNNGFQSKTGPRALVVFLKLQAHIFFLSGTSHVISLPFEVDKVFPAPCGVILQRKIPVTVQVPISPIVPPPPNNSFWSPPSVPRWQPSIQISQSDGKQEKDLLAGFAFSLLRGHESSIADNIPRHFALTDPLSEVGLVVCEPSSANQPPTTAHQTPGSALESLPKDEEIVYVSASDEIPIGENNTDAPLVLIVTQNWQKGTFSFWHASYLGTKPVSSLFGGRKTTTSGASTRRRSSFVSGTGTTTPTIRGRESIRESFGGVDRGKAPSTLHEGQLRASQNSQSAEDALFSQLDPEIDSRQPAKESRRVSLLLSRAELSTNFDRSAFHELATQRSTSGVTGQQHGRRGHSIGASTNRSSLGIGASRRLRASTPGSLSRLSLDDGSESGTLVNFGASTSATIDELDEDELSNYPLEDELDLHQPIDGLKKEILVRKFAERVIFDENLGKTYGPLSRGEQVLYSRLYGFHEIAEILEQKPEARVFVVASPKVPTAPGSYDRRLFVHIVHYDTNQHIQTELSVGIRTLTQPARYLSKLNRFPRTIFIPTLMDKGRNKDIADAVKISDGNSVHVVLMKNSIAERSRLSKGGLWICIPWCPVLTSTYYLEHDEKLGETTPDHEVLQGVMMQLHHPGPNGTFDVLMDNGQFVRLQLQLTAQDYLAKTILELGYFILPAWLGAYFNATWWIRSRSSKASSNLHYEWDALLQALLLLALGLDYDGVVKVGDRYEFRRPLAPKTVRLMLSRESVSTRSIDPVADLPQLESSRTDNGESSPFTRIWTNASSVTASNLVSDDVVQKSNFNSILRNARAFQASDTGQAMSKMLRGAVPLAQIGLSRMLVALHLLFEERKLNVMSATVDKAEIAPILAQLGRWVDWSGWDWKLHSYYGLQLDLSLDHNFEDTELTWAFCPHLQYLKEPPSIFSWLENAFSPNPLEKFPSISSVIEHIRVEKQGEQSRQQLEEFAMRMTPRTYALSKYMDRSRSRQLSAQKRVELSVECGITTAMLETFPEAVAAPFREAVSQCRTQPSTTWPAELLMLINREDLILTQAEEPLRGEGFPVPSTPLNRNVHGVCQAAESQEQIPVGADTGRFAIARLIFNEDRRFVDALRMIEPVRLIVAECIPDPSWSEAQLFEAQKEVVQLVMVRTFALAPGLGIAQFNSRRPLLTEKYVIHGYSTACLMKPMNNTIMADRTTYTEEKYGWAWFHAGVAAGLAISRHAEGIDTSWIVFNKPADPNNRHAGLLLALGLNGHLKGIAKWLAFKYLTPKHTMTSIGLLLGMSASHLGTMDTLVTRLLSVHVTRMLPPGAAELNLSPLAQTTGLMGIGLLYYNTQHRRMSEIMLSEVESTESEDPSSGAADHVRDESYRLAAGFALGYINIGKGKDLKGLHDMRLVERLLAVAVGPRPVNLVHILDQATAGATIAIAIIFMKTHNTAIAQKIDIPDTLPQFDYVRPDILLLRTLAKHLILWDCIRADSAWITQNLPPQYHPLHNLRNIGSLQSEHMPFYNILAGLLWSISLRYAGSGNLQVRDFLIKYLDQFIRLCRLAAVRYDAKLTRNTVHNCQDLIALACATVMAGTGDIEVMRRLRLLHGRINADTSYGSHLAAHMALGALFVGGGSFTFGTSDIAIASLIVAFYPLFPADVIDNKAHLQALRHLWVLAIEPRCIIVRDFDTHRPIQLPLTMTLRDGSMREIKAPCLLPELESIAKVETTSEEYWPATLDFENNQSHLEHFRRHQTLHVRRRPAHETHASPFFTSLVVWNEALSSILTTRRMWAWIFSLPAFAEFELEEFGLVLPNSVERNGVHVGLDGRGTVVDDRLVLRRAVEGWDRDKLWNLRLLFAWAERQVDEESRGRMRWLGREVVEGLQAIIEERRRVAEEVE